jgi:hypothetical protein
MFALDERCVCLGGQHLPAPLEALKGDLPVVGSLRKFGSMAGGTAGSALCNDTEPTLLGAGCKC